MEDDEYDRLTDEFFDAMAQVRAPLEEYVLALNSVRERAADMAQLAKADLARQRNA